MCGAAATRLPLIHLHPKYGAMQYMSLKHNELMYVLPAPALHNTTVMTSFGCSQPGRPGVEHIQAAVRIDVVDQLVEVLVPRVRIGILQQSHSIVTITCNPESNSDHLVAV